MQGVKRATQYGYSLYEFEVYNTATTPQFALTATAPTNGPIAPAGATQVLQGASQTFTFTPASGYGVGTVLIDGQNVGQLTSYTFTDVLANHTVAVNFVPAAAAVNMALNMATHQSGDETVGATGDATDGLSSNLAVDGNLNTRWSSDWDDNAWMTIDLGAPKTFNQLVLYWQNAYGKSYLIQTSNTNNGTDWQTVYTQAASQGGMETDTLTTPATARYVRMQGVQRATQYGYSLFERADLQHRYRRRAARVRAPARARPSRPSRPTSRSSSGRARPSR
jgi:beta-galactosidase